MTRSTSRSTSRPSLEPKVTRKTEKKRTSELEVGIRVTFDGEVYEVRYGDLTSDLVRELRRNAGVGWHGLLSAMNVDPDIDVVAAFLWLARRVAGEDVAYADVVITYQQFLDGFDLDQIGDEDVKHTPEADGGR